VAWSGPVRARVVSGLVPFSINAAKEERSDIDSTRRRTRCVDSLGSPPAVVVAVQAGRQADRQAWCSIPVHCNLQLDKPLAYRPLPNRSDGLRQSRHALLEVVAAVYD
jgi:hypothetical protein